MKPLILSIDIGTSSCKVVLFDVFGRETAMCSESYELHYPGLSGFVEQKPEEIWKGVSIAVRKLRIKASEDWRYIAALSLTGQISSYFLIDRNGDPLIDIVTWMDHRAAKEAEELAEAFPSEKLHAHYGAVLPAGAAWPIPKLKWLSRHCPDILDKARYIVQPKDWMLHKLTGEWKSDVSSLRGLVHQTNRSVCTELLSWAGADSSVILPIGEPFETAGALLPSAAEQLDLLPGIPVILGTNDLNCSVLGMMGREQHIGFDITGTSEHIGVVARKDTAPGLSCAPGLNRIPLTADTDLIYGVTSSGGLALQWFVRQIAGDNLQAVIESASRIRPGCDNILFLPYLQGERSPWWNPNARGVFFGLSPHHERGHMARAVLEGVGFALRAIHERLETKPSVYRIGGGGGRIDPWNRIKASILGVPMERMETSETGCLGAAILATYGTGLYGSIEEAQIAMTRTKEICEPVTLEQQIYDKIYPHFIELYESLVPLFEKTADHHTEGGPKR